MISGQVKSCHTIAMYEEDMIFGPLTAKQFLVLAIGIGLGYFAKTEMTGTSFYIAAAVIAIITLLAIIRFKPKKIEFEHLETYFQNKKSQMTPEEYKGYINRKIAEVQGQMHFRAEKGLPEDSKLTTVYQMLDKARQI